MKHILYLLLVLPLLMLGSCNTEDDVDEIFISGTWNVVNYFGKANWEKRNGEPFYKMGLHKPGRQWTLCSLQKHRHRCRLLPPS